MNFRDIFPKRYFSRDTLPYWSIVILDAVSLLIAELISVYYVMTAVLIIGWFWELVRFWFISLPLFLAVQYLFRTYGGIIAKTLKLNLLHTVVALLISIGFITVVLLSQPFYDFQKFNTVYVMLSGFVISSALFCLVRIMGKAMITVEKNEKGQSVVVFRSTIKKGFIVDNSLAARKKINLCLAHMSDAGFEKKYVNEAFDTNWVVPLGPNVNAFEKDLEDFVSDGYEAGQEKKVAALSAGTAAVHLALRAIGVVPGDEVIVQSFTFCASANPVTYLGAVPVFVDSEPDTWNMDPVLLEKAIQDRISKTGKKPKAIIPVALYGMPYRIDHIMEIANRYDIPVVEDAAEGLGSRFNGKVLGTFGKFGVLSFNGNKMITTSGGGALVTSSPAEKNNILWYATQARESYPYYQHEDIGYNYRMSNVCAGIGRGQMTVLNDHIDHHKHVQELYEELLANVPGITVHKAPKHPDDGEKPVFDSNYWLCTITLDPSLRIWGQESVYGKSETKVVGGAAGVLHASDELTTDCQPNDNVEALRVWLDREQIEARPLWKPMHKQPVYKNAPAYVNGVSESLFKVGLCLPSGPWVSPEDVTFIVDAIKRAIVA